MREGAYADSLLNQQYYITEALPEVEKQGYGKRHEEGKVRLAEGRKAETAAIDSLLVRFYGDPFVPHSGDLIMSRGGPLAKKNLESYRFEISDTLLLDTMKVFQVDFLLATKNQILARSLLLMVLMQ